MKHVTARSTSYMINPAQAYALFMSLEHSKNTTVAMKCFVGLVGALWIMKFALTGHTRKQLWGVCLPFSVRPVSAYFVIHNFRSALSAVKHACWHPSRHLLLSLLTLHMDLLMHATTTKLTGQCSAASMQWLHPELCAGQWDHHSNFFAGNMRLFGAWAKVSSTHNWLA